MRALRIICSIMALFVMVVAMAAIALLIFIDPNKLKPVLATELKKQTGYETKVEGKFSWSFYPWLGIKVDHIALFVPNKAVPFVDLHNVVFVTELSRLFQSNKKISGDIFVSNIKLLNVNLQNAHIGVNWQNQILAFYPITADLYQGKLEGSAQVSGLSDLPHWTWDVKASSFNCYDLLQDLNGVNNQFNIAGAGEMKLSASTQGNTRAEILSNLNGTSQFSLKHGSINGIDLNYLTESADAIINKKPLNPPPTSAAQTTFDDFSGRIVIKNGIAVTNDLTLASSILKASGEGSINLNYQAINLQLKLVPEQQINPEWIVPVMITGDLYRPDARLDVTELNIMMAKEKLDQVKSKVNAEIKTHISGKTAKLLQNLLDK